MKTCNYRFDVKRLTKKVVSIIVVDTTPQNARSQAYDLLQREWGMVCVFGG
jgi:hypothetical protein